MHSASESVLICEFVLLMVLRLDALPGVRAPPLGWISHRTCDTSRSPCTTAAYGPRRGCSLAGCTGGAQGPPASHRPHFNDQRGGQMPLVRLMRSTPRARWMPHKARLPEWCATQMASRRSPSWGALREPRNQSRTPTRMQCTAVAGLAMRLRRKVARTAHFCTRACARANTRAFY